jgi:DNA repair exonuclease SbcCD ATPase subunit
MNTTPSPNEPTPDDVKQDRKLAKEIRDEYQRAKWAGMVPNEDNIMRHISTARATDRERIKELEKERDCWIDTAKALQADYNKLEKKLTLCEQALAKCEEALKKIASMTHTFRATMPHEVNNRTANDALAAIAEYRKKGEGEA